MRILLLSLLFVPAFGHAAPYCPTNAELLATGWVQHPAAELGAVRARLQDDLAGPGWERDLETEFDSEITQFRVHFRSWDRLATPTDEMFGDAVFYSHPEDNSVFEIRWYEGGRKHFVVPEGGCSCDSAPLGENALF